LPDGTVRLALPSGGGFSEDRTITFFPGFAGSVRTATADVTGDGVDDYIGGAGPGGLSLLGVIDGKTGATLATFPVFEASFNGGVFVAAADLDGDGKAEVIVSPDQGGGPVVAVFSGARLSQGQTGDAAQLVRFLGIEDDSFRGGARPTLGDVNGDGTADVIVSAGFLGGPRIAIFNGKDVAAGSVKPGHLVADFFAFEQTLRNGAFVGSGGDLDGDGADDIAFGGGPGGASRVRVLSGKKLSAAGGFGTLDQVAASAGLADFFAYDSSLRGGVRLAIRDADGDGNADLLAGSGENEIGKVRVYKAATVRSGAAAPDQDLTPFGASVLANGVFVG